MACAICQSDHATSEPCTVVRPGGVGGTGTQVVAAGVSAFAAAAAHRAPTPQAQAASTNGNGHQMAAPLAATPHPMPAYATPAPPPSPDAEVDPLLGTTIGSFKVLRKLGVGGMGTVYLGEQGFIGSKVAIKVLHPHLASNASLVQRFYAEARAANVIGHEHIVTIIDLNLLPPNRYYFIMEYLEGKQLSELPRPVPQALLVHLLTQVCDALQAAHTNGVVHRDLKPENIVLIKRGRNDQFVKILDFGIAKLFASELAGQQTAVGVIMGTPEFMAPEQTAAEDVDGRTDLYSLGVIAYELATGKLPFLGANVADLLIAHRIKDAVPPHLVNPAVPENLSAAIMKALAKKPADRWQSADEFCAALEATMVGVAPYRSTTTPRALPTAGPSAPVVVVPPPAAPAPKGATPPPASTKTPRPSASTPTTVARISPSSPGQPAPPPRSEPGRSGSFPAAAPSSSSSRSGPLPTASAPDRQPTPVVSHALTWDTKVFDQPNGFRLAKGTDVSRGGMFLQTDASLPAMFARVKVALVLPEGDYPLNAEVVRHVTPEQARAWNMPVGFGVQFLELTATQREDLATLGRTGSRTQPGAARVEEKDDAKVEQALAPLKKRLGGTHYELFGLPEDIDFAEIRQRGRDAKKLVAELRQHPVSSRQKLELDAVDKRLDEAMTIIGQPKNRLDYDAGRSNWKGVARSIAGGVSVTDLDQARRRYLSSHDKVEGNAHLHFTTGNAWESQKDFERAKSEFERALVLDPLNLAYHQRYQALRRLMNAPLPAAKK